MTLVVWLLWTRFCEKSKGLGLPTQGIGKSLTERLSLPAEENSLVLLACSPSQHATTPPRFHLDDQSEQNRNRKPCVPRTWTEESRSHSSTLLAAWTVKLLSAPLPPTSLWGSVFPQKVTFALNNYLMNKYPGFHQPRVASCPPPHPSPHDLAKQHHSLESDDIFLKH